MEEGPGERLVMIQAKVDRMKMTGLRAKKKKSSTCRGQRFVRKRGTMEVGRFGKPRDVEVEIGINFLEALKSKDKFSEECRNCT